MSLRGLQSLPWRLERPPTGAGDGHPVAAGPAPSPSRPSGKASQQSEGRRGETPRPRGVPGRGPTFPGCFGGSPGPCQAGVASLGPGWSPAHRQPFVPGASPRLGECWGRGCLDFWTLKPGCLCQPAGSQVSVTKPCLFSPQSDLHSSYIIFFSLKSNHIFKNSTKFSLS